MAYRILFVDDDGALLERLAQVLRQAGYDVLTAPDAERALVLADELQGNCDLLLTDWRLPNRDGVWLAREIHARYPAMKLAMLTGLIEVEDLPPGPDPGLAIMRKPVGDEELVDWVGQLLA
jgi:two-component system response regulator GlrR